jgi:hypothetical protein
MKRLDVEQEQMLQEAVAAATGSRERWPGGDVVLQVKTEGSAGTPAAVASVVAEAVQSLTGAAAPAAGEASVQTLAGSGVETLSSLASSASGAVQPLVSMLPGQSSSGGSSWVQWLNPIVGGLLSLFGGGGSEPAPAVLMPYERAEKQQYKAGFGESGGDVVMPVDYGQNGLTRPNVGQSGQSIVVQVQAMDSKSFLDHTPEIAQAVKRALLESEGLPAAMSEF